MVFIKAIVVVAFIANSGNLINDTCDAISQVYQSSGASGDGIRQALDGIRSNNVAARACRAEQAPSVLDFFGQMKTLLEDLLVSLGTGLTMAIWAVVWVFRFLQDVFVVMLFILLPLAFGFLSRNSYSIDRTGPTQKPLSVHHKLPLA